jgi:hypothetical protein
MVAVRAGALGADAGDAAEAEDVLLVLHAVLVRRACHELKKLASARPPTHPGLIHMSAPDRSRAS